MEIAALSAALAVQTPSMAGPAPRADPAALATERFNAIMNGPDVVGAPPAPFAAAPPDAAPTLGGQILNGLRGVAADVSGRWEDIARGLDSMGARPAAGEMLRLQTELLKVSVQYELVGKAVSGTTDDIDTLVRMS
ncbi:EscI/YscI/HrpB family type III secretion system inner rod protein [Castellaniella sp. WN]